MSDYREELKNKEKEKKASEICLEKIKKHGLDMKLIGTEYTFDIIKYCFILRRMEELTFVNW